MKYSIQHEPQYNWFCIYKKRGWFGAEQSIKRFSYPSTGATREDMLAAQALAQKYVTLLKEIDDCIN